MLDLDEHPQSVHALNIMHQSGAYEKSWVLFFVFFFNEVWPNGKALDHQRKALERIWTLTSSFLMLLSGIRGEWSDLAHVPSMMYCPWQRSKAMEST